jgi:hypothetical protein
MIANFCYTVRPDENCVAVAMTWSSDGSRQGTLIVPSFCVDKSKQRECRPPKMLSALMARWHMRLCWR